MSRIGDDRSVVERFAAGCGVAECQASFGVGLSWACGTCGAADVAVRGLLVVDLTRRHDDGDDDDGDGGDAADDGRYHRRWRRMAVTYCANGESVVAPAGPACPRAAEPPQTAGLDAHRPDCCLLRCVRGGTSVGLAVRGRRSGGFGRLRAGAARAVPGHLDGLTGTGPAPHPGPRRSSRTRWSLRVFRRLARRRLASGPPRSSTCSADRPARVRSALGRTEPASAGMSSSR